MKLPRNRISSYIAETGLRHGLSKHMAEEIAAYLLAEKRSSELDSIVRDVWQYWADAGVVEVLAISAFAISRQVEADIKAEIAKIFPEAKKLIIIPKLDASVVAGIRLEFAGQQLDLTTVSKLNRFKQLIVS